MTEISQVDFDLPKITYKEVKGVKIARFFIQILYDSELFFNDQLLKIGYEPNEKWKDNPRCAFCYVLKRNNKRVVTAKYRESGLECYLDIAGLTEDVERTYEYFKKEGVFYFNTRNINVFSNFWEGIIKIARNLKNKK
jgi:hypothetical protein